MIRVRVQTDPFDTAAECRELSTGNAKVGALVTFVGLMRDMNEGDTVQALTLEHYPGMTERSLESIAAQADTRWDLEGITLIHRVGRLTPEEPIVLVAVASRHRGEAFRACEMLIDYLKTQAPFWKKEETEQGERWVEARHGDDAAADRWRD